MAKKQSSGGTSTLPFIAAEYENRKITIRRNPNYQETVVSVKKVFDSLQSTPNKLILLGARFEEIDDVVQITEDLWPVLMPKLVVVKVLLNRPSQPTCTDCKGMQISVKLHNGRTASIEVFPNTTIAQLKADLEIQEDVSFEQYELLFEEASDPFEDDSTVAQCKIKQGSKLVSMHMIMFMRVKKPVIYLLPPASIFNVQVNLSLVKSWNFSTLYPATPINSDKSLGLGQSVTWTVDAKPDGTLFDHGTRREVTYLYWEADATVAKFLPSPASSRHGTPTAELDTEIASPFDPSRPTLSPSNSALLPLDKVMEYIDDALLAMGLHTEARTSFITFWLPDLQEHAYIALRFVPQDQYEAAAPLNVTPAPQVTTRVFMLFKGVEEDELEMWESARSLAQQGADVWKNVVGVNLEKAQDTGLFRVLEWGGMEIK